MRDLIILGVLYLAVLLGFRWLGGLIAAGEAIQEWGRRATRPC
jgi:hypothetical protein